METRYQSPETTFAQLKEEYRYQPDKLKFIEAQERVFFSSRPNIKDEEIMGVLMDGLRDWVENPLSNEPLEITGFARLMNEIRRFESDAFSATSERVTQDEALLVANILIDRAVNQTLSGALIKEALEEVRNK